MKDKPKRKRSRRVDDQSEEGFFFDAIVIVAFSFSTPTPNSHSPLALAAKSKLTNSSRSNKNIMAPSVALCLLLAALVALAAAPSPSSAAPCFHGKRLTSAPITLKAAKKNSKGATSAHSSFNGVSEPVRESGYFKVSSKREEKKEKKA